MKNKINLLNVLYQYYNIQKQAEMLLDIVTEYNSKVTFLSIQKKQVVSIKFIALYKLFIYIYYSKIKKIILFKTGGKIFLN
jgi:hypothetical protein